MTDWRSDRIGAADRGENPLFVARLKSAYVFLGDFQFLPGYCVLHAHPTIETLEELPESARVDFLTDMSRVGLAVKAACSPRRVNYAIYGNAAPFLHAHVFPRYHWEAPERVTQPVWTYPEAMWRDPLPLPDSAEREALKQRIRALLLADHPAQG